MKHIIVAGFHGALASAITGAVDVLALAGVSWQRIMAIPPTPAFKVSIASVDGEPVRCLNGLELSARVSFQQVIEQQALRDSLLAIVVPTIGTPIETTLQENPGLLELLHWAHGQSLIVMGNCTGNFFLAEAGLLDGKTATTHWGYQEQFRQRYPKVDLQADKLITEADHVYCAGGGLAWFDLAIHLIEKELGYEAALQSAKAFVIDYRRESQLSYSLSRLAVNHHDDVVAGIQVYLDRQYGEPHHLDELAIRFNLSKRTLIRRFKQALNITPLAYLQGVRIEVSQKLLAESPLGVEQVMARVGYEDMSAFRRLFRQRTGLTPAEYRKRFAKRC